MAFFRRRLDLEHEVDDVKRKTEQNERDIKSVKHRQSQIERRLQLLQRELEVRMRTSI